MLRVLLILACAALILLGTVASIVARPGKTTVSPMQYPVPAYVDIIRDFSAPLTVGDGTGKGRNREIGDVHHSNAVRLPLPFDHKMSPVLSGGKNAKNVLDACPCGVGRQAVCA